MKYFLMDVYLVCSNKSPWVKIGPAGGGGGEAGGGKGEQGAGEIIHHHGPLVYIIFLLFTCNKTVKCVEINLIFNKFALCCSIMLIMDNNLYVIHS
jgi:hypothetical protein